MRCALMAENGVLLLAIGFAIIVPSGVLLTGMKLFIEIEGEDETAVTFWPSPEENPL